ncbi:hypothetical protein PG993_003825 [Apiospora rasikravindrae]|uniref:Uncharacterized protein n=1 Tax=Apiospora rasikravindrae TaxID=990691 RepID=A0ABR1U0L9_9PEZI
MGAMPQVMHHVAGHSHNHLVEADEEERNGDGLGCHSWREAEREYILQGKENLRLPDANGHFPGVAFCGIIAPHIWHTFSRRLEPLLKANGISGAFSNTVKKEENTTDEKKDTANLPGIKPTHGCRTYKKRKFQQVLWACHDRARSWSICGGLIPWQ